ncbi:MAG: translation initiation factor IF-3 [Deinococcus sp.]|nr:translation initiation factor IF-3 [Deinococcus sp.]
MPARRWYLVREYRRNEQIRVRQVRLIDEQGAQLGIMDTREAIRIARERELDLVLVGETSNPPVCKILNYGKFRYELAQKEREDRKSRKTQELKSIKLRPKIDDHDYQTKLNHVRRFLQQGNKVKVTIMFRGRERLHLDLGKDLLLDVAKDTKDLASPESPPKVLGMDMNMILVPNKHPGAGA